MMPNPDNTSQATRETPSAPASAGAAGSAIPPGPAIQERDLRERAAEVRASAANPEGGPGGGRKQSQSTEAPFTGSADSPGSSDSAGSGDSPDERASGYGDGIEPDREPDLDEPGRRDPADSAAPQQTTTGAVNRGMKAAQQPADARATTLSTADPAARMDRGGADQDAMAGDAVRTRPHSTPMRPAPTPASAPDTVLQPETSRRFRERWHAIQAEFVDDPRHAVEDADRLLTDVTSAFTSGLEERRRALSTSAQPGGQAETEQLRLTMRRYRALVDAMLHD